MTDTQAQDATTDDATQDDASHDSQATEQDSTPTGFDALPKETQDEIKALRRENAKHRKAIKDHEDAQKTELERIQSQAEEYRTELESLRTQIRDRTAESAFMDAATKANARAPKTLFRAYKADLEFDDDGTPTNVDTLLSQLQKDEPELFRQSTGSADGGRKGESTTEKFDINDAFRDMAKSAR